MLDADELVLDRWPANDAEWAKLIEQSNIPPAIIRRGIVFDAQDPTLHTLELPGSADGQHPITIRTFRDLACPECDRPVVVVFQPWGTEPIRAMVSEIRGSLEAIAWHDRHPHG